MKQSFLVLMLSLMVVLSAPLRAADTGIQKAQGETEAGNTVLPKFEIRGATFGECVMYLKSKLKSDDRLHGEVTFDVSGLSGPQLSTPIQLSLRNVYLSDVVYQLAKAINCQVQWTANHIRFVESGSHDLAWLNSDERRAAVDAKMNEIVIPVVVFREAPLELAAQFLSQRSRELDGDSHPAGLNFLASKKFAQKKISLNLKDVTLTQAALETAKAGGVQVTIEGGLVIFAP